MAAFVYQALVKAGRVDPIAVKPERRWQITPITTIAAEAYRMSLSGNGQQLAAITDLGQNIKIWNTQTGSLLRTVIPEEPDSVFTEVAISKDGTKIAFIKTTLPTDAIQLTVQTIENGSVLLTKSLNPPKDQLPEANDPIAPGLSRFNVVFSPDGKQVITQVKLKTTTEIDSSYNRLDFQDIATGKVTQSIALALSGSINTGFALSSDGSLLATTILSDSESSPTTAVEIWRKNNNNQFDRLAPLPISKNGFVPIDITFTNSNLLNVVTSKSNRFYLDTWNPQTEAQVQSTMLPSEECIGRGGAVPSSDGTSYFASYSNLGVCFGNIQTESFQSNPDGLLTRLWQGVFSGNGDAITVADDREIRIFTKAAP